MNEREDDEEDVTPPLPTLDEVEAAIRSEYEQRGGRATPHLDVRLAQVVGVPGAWHVRTSHGFGPEDGQILQASIAAVENRLPRVRDDQERI